MKRGEKGERFQQIADSGRRRKRSPEEGYKRGKAHSDPRRCCHLLLLVPLIRIRKMVARLVPPFPLVLVLLSFWPVVGKANLLSPSRSNLDDGPVVLYRKLSSAMKAAGDAHMVFKLPYTTATSTAKGALDKVTRINFMAEPTETPELVQVQVLSIDAGVRLSHQLRSTGIEFRPGPFGKSSFDSMDETEFQSVHAAWPFSPEQIVALTDSANDDGSIKVTCDPGWDDQLDHYNSLFIRVDHLGNYTNLVTKEIVHYFYSEGKQAVKASADYLMEFSRWSDSLVRSRLANNIIAQQSLSECYNILDTQLKKNRSDASIVQSLNDLQGRKFSYNVVNGSVIIVLHLTYVEQNGVYDVFEVSAAPISTPSGIFGLVLPTGLLAISTLPSKSFFKIDARSYGSFEEYNGHRVCDAATISYVRHAGKLLPSDIRCAFSIYHHNEPVSIE